MNENCFQDLPYVLSITAITTCGMLISVYCDIKIMMVTESVTCKGVLSVISSIVFLLFVWYAAYRWYISGEYPSVLVIGISLLLLLLSKWPKRKN